MEKDSINGENQKLIKSIQENGMSAIESIYEKYRRDFMKFAILIKM